MLIKIISPDSGLKVNQTYNLCDIAAKSLIEKGMAILPKAEKPKAEKPKAEKPKAEKPKAETGK